MSPLADSAVFRALRERLLRYFERRECGSASSDLADETLFRVHRKAAEGEVIQDVNRYAYTVAGFVFMEWLDKLQKDRRVAEALRDPPSRAPDPNLEDALRRCLAALPAEQRELLELYHIDEIESDVLAARLGITPGAVRSRAFRYAERLAACIAARLRPHRNKFDYLTHLFGKGRKRHAAHG